MKLSKELPEKGLMETAIYRYRREAFIRVSPDLEINDEYERLIVHELLHLIVDPMCERYEQVIEALVAENIRPSKDMLEPSKLEMERTVEHLSHVLYDK